jgi:hypothetical protein
MYTVIRFTLPADRLGELERVGAGMNAKSPGTYNGIRRAKDGFSCSLSTSREWRIQKEATLAFLNTFADEIGNAIALGTAVTVDLAFEPEDLENCPHIKTLHLDPVFLETLAKASVAFEFSVYVFAVPDPASDCIG